MDTCGICQKASGVSDMDVVADPPKAGDSMHREGIALGLLTAATVASITGCSSTSGKTDTSSACPAPTPIVDADVATAVASVKLPDGATVTSGRVTTISSEPGMVGVALDVCGLKDVDTADKLRPTATQFAHAVKASPKGEAVSAMWVNLDFYEDGKITRDIKLKDDAFESHLWNGKAVCCVEDGSWKVLSE